MIEMWDGLMLCAGSNESGLTGEARSRGVPMKPCSAISVGSRSCFRVFQKHAPSKILRAQRKSRTHRCLGFESRCLQIFRVVHVLV